MSKATENLESAQRRAMAGRPKVGGFPYLAETLRPADVIRNFWFLPACQSLFLTDNGPVVDRAKTVQKPVALKPLGIALSEKQIPQTIENIRSVEN